MIINTGIPSPDDAPLDPRGGILHQNTASIAHVSCDKSVIDGVGRHPVQVYEMLFVMALAWSLHLARRYTSLRPGDRFRAFVVGYFVFRFGVEFLKPPFGPASSVGDSALVPAIYGGLTAIQLASLFGAVLYAKAAARTVRATFGPVAENAS